MIVNGKGRSRVSIDGRVYEPRTDEELDFLCERVVNSEDGKRLMIYLESITTRRVLTPSASDAELRHLEGARWLLSVVRGRSNNGVERRAAIAEPPKEKIRVKPVRRRRGALPPLS